MKPKFPEELRKAGPGIPPATFGKELATTPRHAGWAFEIQKTSPAFSVSDFSEIGTCELRDRAVDDPLYDLLIQPNTES